MKPSFKQFVEKKRSEPKAPKVVPIVETTVPDHLQHKAENWDHHSMVSDETQTKMTAAMGGKSFTHFPLNNDNHNDIDADVAEHLTKHNYAVKDYSKGIATIKKQVGDPERGIPMREKHIEEKIGSVLQKTGASEDVKKAFVNDPARTSTKSFSGGHHVVITHSPLGIAGMSTGTNWANQSCMDMDRQTGHNHHLESDSEHGTHVAYLVHHDDHTAFSHGLPSKPIARIALKAFHEQKDNHHSDTIFRPEAKMYGSGSSRFDGAVSHWAASNYPAKGGVEYTKNSDLYDDSGQDKYKAISKDDVEHSIKNSEPIVGRNGDSVDKEMIDHAIFHGRKQLDNPSPNFSKHDFMEHMRQIGNLNTQHVAALNSIATQHDIPVRGLAVSHGDKFSTSAIEKHMENGNSITKSMLMNPKLPSKAVDSLDPNELPSVRKSLIKPHHVDKVVDHFLNNGSGSAYSLRDMSDRKE